MTMGEALDRCSGRVDKLLELLEKIKGQHCEKGKCRELGQELEREFKVLLIEDGAAMNCIGAWIAEQEKALNEARRGEGMLA